MSSDLIDVIAELTLIVLSIGVIEKDSKVSIMIGGPFVSPKICQKCTPAVSLKLALAQYVIFRFLQLGKRVKACAPVFMCGGNISTNESNEYIGSLLGGLLFPFCKGLSSPHPASHRQSKIPIIEPAAIFLPLAASTKNMPNTQPVKKDTNKTKMKLCPLLLPIAASVMQIIVYGISAMRNM